MAAFGVFARYPWQTACITLLLASVWLWHGWDKADAKLKSCEIGRVADRKAYTDAQATALVKAKAAKAATEKKYSDLAERTDADAQKAHNSAMADTSEFIRAHRLRSKALSGPSSSATPATQNNGSGVSTPVPADTVLVNESDVQACAADAAYGVNAHNWAVSLTAAHD